MSHRVFHVAICCYLGLGFSISRAMTLEAIVAELKAQPVVDTFDVNMNATVSVKGRAIAMASHIISKGPEKIWMEQQSPAGVQRIIRNGDKVQSTNLRTGQKQTLSVTELAGMMGAMPPQASFFDRGRFSAPKSIGMNQYQVDMIPGTDSLAFARSIVYDASQKSIVKITQVGVRQDTTLTELTQGIISGKRVLTRMKMNIRVSGFETQMQMEYSDFTFPNSILDGLFTIKE